MADAPDPEFLRRFLAQRDIPCPACGYNLRGLTSTRCPECAEPLTLQVGLQEPRMAGFFAGLVGLAAGLGFSGLLLGYFVIQIFLLRRNISPVRDFLLITAGGALVQGILLWRWLQARHRIRRCDPTRAFFLVVACWAVTLANLVVFTRYVR